MTDKALVFDLDDTLYRRNIPYLEMVRGRFGHRFDGLENELYRVSLRMSDEEYEKRVNGQITLREMTARRMVRTFAVFHITLTDDEALEMEEEYVERLSHIRPVPEMISLINMARRKGCSVGILSNGPSERQRLKIHQLGLDRLIPASDIFISSEKGFHKPEASYFRLYEAEHHLTPSSLWIVGDRYAADIGGAMAVGWHAVWFHHPYETVPDKRPYRPDFESDSAGEILAWFENHF